MNEPSAHQELGNLSIDPQPTTLAVMVYESIRRDIRSGDLAPGQALRSDWLKSHYQTGVSPIREALARLAAEHMVTAEGKRGYRVSRISETDFDEIVDLVKDLELQAIELAIAKGNDDWESRIVASFHKLTKTTPPGLTNDPLKAEERELRHRNFHNTIVSACGSRWRLRFLNHLFSHLERYRRIMTANQRISAEAAQEIEEEHRALMERVIERKTSEACAILDVHRNRTILAIKRAFALEHKSDSNLPDKSAQTSR